MAPKEKGSVSFLLGVWGVGGVGRVTATLGKALAARGWRAPTWQNLWFPFSWGAFLLFMVRSRWYFVLSWGIAFLLSFCACLLPPLWGAARRQPRWAQGFALATAAGLLHGAAFSFCSLLFKRAFFYTLLESVPCPSVLIGCVVGSVGVLCLAGGGALFCLLSLFYGFVSPGVKTVFGRTTVAERCVLIGLVVALGGLSAWAIGETSAFGMSGDMYDVVYTADSIFARGNVCLQFTHPENDLRQPLFAFFAAPWVGVPWFLAATAGIWADGSLLFPLGVSVAQAVAMVFGAALLAQMLGLRQGLCRAGFCAWLTMSYGMTLFTVQSEQYAFAFAWLMLLVFAWASPLRAVRRLRLLAFLGATGTLVIGGAMELLESVPTRLKSVPSRVMRLIGEGVCFLAALLFAMQIHVLLNAAERTSMLMKFTGEGIPFLERLTQWLAFLSMAILPPAASGQGTAWRLLDAPPPHELWVGAALAAACGAIGLALFRRDRLARLCLAWVGVSFVLLCLVGWGTAENGLVLYTPYFVWAVLGLLTLALARAARRFGQERLLPVVLWGCALATACATVGALFDMVTHLAEMWPR